MFTDFNLLSCITFRHQEESEKEHLKKLKHEILTLEVLAEDIMGARLVIPSPWVGS